MRAKSLRRAEGKRESMKPVIGIIAACTREVHPAYTTGHDYVRAVERAGGLALLLRVLQGAGEALSALPDLFGRAGLSGELSGMLLRSAGIAVAAELGAQLCRDAGSGALAQKVELGGKILILCAALPMVLDLCDAVLLLLG